MCDKERTKKEKKKRVVCVEIIESWSCGGKKKKAGLYVKNVDVVVV